MTDLKKRILIIAQKHPFFFKCLVIWIFFLHVSPALSADGIGTEKIIQPDTPWHITAKQITYDQNSQIYTATGDVQIFNADKKLSAETIKYNQTTMQAESTGNVRLTAGKDTLRGDTIIINLKTGIGTIVNGSIFIEKSHFYIRGDKILKTGENSYTIENGSVTTCDGNLPPWRITGRKVDITIEEYGTVRHAALWVKKLPVFYIPYLIFPVNVNRQSGLLPTANRTLLPERDGVYSALLLGYRPIFRCDILLSSPPEQR